MARVEMSQDELGKHQDPRILSLLAASRELEERITDLRDGQGRLAHPQQVAFQRLHECGFWIETWLIEDAGIKLRNAQQADKAEADKN